MINVRDVIRMKVPYPSVNSNLAVCSHMYICNQSKNSRHEYIKYQTLKPYMILSNTMKHYVDETADIERNPFQRTTRIDCDKVFATNGVNYSDALKTTVRPDICMDLFCSVQEELYADGYEQISINERDLMGLNPLIT